VVGDLENSHPTMIRRWIAAHGDDTCGLKENPWTKKEIMLGAINRTEPQRLFNVFSA
jgi:hypothetical protein